MGNCSQIGAANTRILKIWGSLPIHGRPRPHRGGLPRTPCKPGATGTVSLIESKCLPRSSPSIHGSPAGLRSSEVPRQHTAWNGSKTGAVKLGAALTATPIQRSKRVTIALPYSKIPRPCRWVCSSRRPGQVPNPAGDFEVYPGRRVFFSMGSAASRRPSRPLGTRLAPYFQGQARSCTDYEMRGVERDGQRRGHAAHRLR